MQLSSMGCTEVKIMFEKTIPELRYHIQKK